MSEIQNHKDVKKAQTEQAYGFYRPSSDDKLDVGFWIKGYKFHWMYSRKHETAQDRPWVPVQRDKLPPGFLKELIQRRPTYFGEDGLIRYAELVLGMARDEDIAPYTAERQRENLAQLKSINAAPKDSKSMKVNAEFENDVDLGADAFKNF